MPAYRLFLGLGLIALLVAAAALVPWLAGVVAGLDLALVAAFAVDWRRAAATPLSAARRWPPLLVQGAPAEIDVEVRTAARRPVVVLLREALHPGVAESPLRTRLALPRRAGAAWSYRLLPRRRGEHRLGPLSARVLGPWRLAWAERELLPAEPRKVFPQVRWEGRVGHLLTLAQRRQLGSVPLSQPGAGSEPYALREYLPGDPRSKIHWKATARHGHLVTREDTWERGGRLLILLDAARAMASADAGRSKLDHALAAALALTRVAAARGDRVTLVAFSDRVERQVRVRSGSHGRAEAYAVLFDLEARLVEPAFDLAAEAALAAEPRGATVVLFTSVVDLAAAELLREALLRLGRRHRPLLVNLEDPELARLAAAAPETSEAAFAQVSALEILLANLALGRHLRRAGVRVVTTSADRLALEVLEAYLASFHLRLLRGRPAGAPRPATAAAS